MPRKYRADFSKISYRINAQELSRTEAGFLRIPLRVSRVGVMEYRNKSNEARFEFKPPQELFNPKTMESLQYVAATDKHPPELFVRPYNSQRLMVGFVCGAPQIENDYYLRSEIILTREDIIEKVIQKFRNNQTQEVSAGYSALIENSPGEFKGEKYDSIQRDIVFNHVALVDVGRAGPDVKLLWPEEESAEKLKTDQAQRPEKQDKKELMVSQKFI